MPTQPLDVPGRKVEIAGRRIFVQEHGRGPAVLLLHGIPTNGELWRGVVPRLEQRARLIVPDLLGYGRSDPPGDRPADIASQAEYMAELLDLLNVESATVVGHDIGGGVAQQLAVRYAGRVDRLGLVNSVCYDSWPIPEMKAIQMGSKLVEHLPPGLTTDGLKLGLQRGFVHKERAEPFLDTFLAPFSTEQGLKVFVQLACSLDSRHTEELVPELPKLSIPVAVVWGEQDPFQKVKWAERLAADIPTADLTLIEDASHFSPADAPDAVADALLRLLNRMG